MATVALLVQGWPNTSQDTPVFCPGCQREVPGGHILAHTGKRPRHSPSSARRSSPHCWAQQVLDNCSGPRLDKTEGGKENGQAPWVSAVGGEGDVSSRKKGASDLCFPCSRPVLPSPAAHSTQRKSEYLHGSEAQQMKAPWAGGCPAVTLAARLPPGSAEGLWSRGAAPACPGPQTSLHQLLPHHSHL